ncbi:MULTISPECIES: CRISPR-associated endonuclease Cas2 [unclassified Thiocapsa]|uniref:CRISPR-associated endonuclease Cas2 n=1 Tax=unclassified Thiocapsa TaxID=2641286 RepID=UPI0035B0BF8F
MHHPGWYLIAYDIAHPRRLQRLHRALQAEAIAIQRSVFLVAGTVADIDRLLDRLATLIDPEEDDLRAYPVGAPDMLRCAGHSVLQGALLSDNTETGPPRTVLAGRWRRMAAPSATDHHREFPT